MFKKKEEKKPEVKVEETPKVKTLEDMNLYHGHDIIQGHHVAYAVAVLRDAVRRGQIRNANPRSSVVGNDICFGYVISEGEEPSVRNITYDGYEYSKVRYPSPVRDLIFVDHDTILQEKICKLKADLRNAQEAQKSKVAEIEKLAKELGELE